MGPTPENPYLVALRKFPARLAQAKKFYEFTNATDLDWNDLAEMVGMTTSVMSEVKLGKRAPRVSEGIDLARLLGVRPEWLLLDSGPMTDEEGRQGAKPGDAPRPSPIAGPTVRRTLPKDVSRLDDLPKGKPAGTPKRRPKDRTALAS